MIREIDGITVDVQKKNIKNMHLRIRKDATVLLTAPMRASEASMTVPSSLFSEYRIHCIL